MNITAISCVKERFSSLLSKREPFFVEKITIIVQNPTLKVSQLEYIDIDDQEKAVPKGVILDILPTVQNDGKEILLKARALIWNPCVVMIPKPDGKKYFSSIQVADIPIHTLVENRGTILIIGPELIVDSKDETSPAQKQRLLILLKPTVVKQQETTP